MEGQKPKRKNYNTGKGVTFYVPEAVLKAFDATLEPGQTRSSVLLQFMMQRISPDSREMETLTLKARMEELLKEF